MRLHRYACLLALPLSLCAQGTPAAPVITESGPHCSVWSWTETRWDDQAQPAATDHSYIEIITHPHIDPAAQRSQYAERLATNLVDRVPNVVMVLSGHLLNGSGVWPRTNNHGRIVNELYLN
jgi:hypothetical protein